jgi:hypothetical protein
MLGFDYLKNHARINISEQHHSQDIKLIPAGIKPDFHKKKKNRLMEPITVTSEKTSLSKKKSKVIITIKNN